MYVLNEYMEFGVDTPHIATYNFKLMIAGLQSRNFQFPESYWPSQSATLQILFTKFNLKLVLELEKYHRESFY